MKNKRKIFVAGHKGMVGNAICRLLKEGSEVKLLTCDRSELDLRSQASVDKFFRDKKPDEVIVAAAKVGGIHANRQFPADFIYDNLQIQSNIIHFAHMNGVERLLFLGSSCIYPRNSSQPMTEQDLLSGGLEPTNEPYAIAKIAGIKMCESYNRQFGRDYRSVMPTNLYGPGDNYHPKNSHVIPALLHRIHKAKEEKRKKVVVWGSGLPLREFMYVDDMAEACLLVHNLDKTDFEKYTHPTCSHVNIGTGQDITIKGLAELIASVVGYRGQIQFDRSLPDGAPRKLLDVQFLKKIGWSAKINLRDGIERTYDDYLAGSIRT